MTQQRQREVLQELQKGCERHGITVYNVIDRYFTENTKPVERFLFVSAQFGHALTNLPVEGIRAVLPSRFNPVIRWLGREKDLAYWVGHLVLVAVSAAIAWLLL